MKDKKGKGTKFQERRKRKIHTEEENELGQNFAYFIKIQLYQILES